VPAPPGPRGTGGAPRATVPPLLLPPEALRGLHRGTAPAPLDTAPEPPGCARRRETAASRIGGGHVAPTGVRAPGAPPVGDPTAAGSRPAPPAPALPTGFGAAAPGRAQTENDACLPYSAVIA